MKKIIITLLALFLLVGCSKEVEWSDVSDTFESVKAEVNEITGNMETLVQDDFKALLAELSDYLIDAKYDISEDNQDLLKRIYKVAYYIETLSSKVNSTFANKLYTLALDTKKLCKAAFEGDETDFEALKQNIKDRIEEINNGSQSDWRSVEIVESVTWADVEEEFEEIEEESVKGLTDSLDITEYELDDLKHAIIDNYDAIADGKITTQNNEIAKQIYYAACRLQAYARRINYNDGQKVRDFVWATKSFIKQSYGAELNEDDELDKQYSEYLNEAKKWTQSTWNELTALMKVEAMAELQAQE